MEIKKKQISHLTDKESINPTTTGLGLLFMLALMYERKVNTTTENKSFLSSQTCDLSPRALKRYQKNDKKKPPVAII